MRASPPTRQAQYLRPAMRDEDRYVGTVLGAKIQVQILCPIGEGGMGRVYLARSTAAQLPYAVKVLQPRLCRDEVALGRFLREALASSSIHHPGVVSVVDAGHLPDGAGYYIMELLVGEDLAKTLRRERRLSWPRVRHIALQVCDALAVVHAHAIVHRDIKPANLFRMTRGVDMDAIKILDFGVAKIASHDVESLTGADALLGTIPYMAPELVRPNGAREGDARGDIWALCVTIHELLTGARPFHAAGVFELILAIQERPPASLAETDVVRDWPIGLETVLARALDKDPGRRYASMTELAISLRALGDASEGRVGGEHEQPALPDAVTVAQVDPAAKTLGSDPNDGNVEVDIAPEGPRPDSLGGITDPPTGSALGVIEVALRDAAEMRFVGMTGGEFTMGSPPDEPGRWNNEGPQRRVYLSPFCIAEHPVTRRQWRAIAPLSASAGPFADDDLPVADVSWFDALEFLNRLSIREGRRPCYTRHGDEHWIWDVTADGYRLPTEAEWEYAARAGTTSAYSFGDDPEQLGAYAWVKHNSGNRLHPVGTRRANPWGLFDMHGQVWEWTWDVFGTFADGPAVDPFSGPDEVGDRALRGGSFISTPAYLRSASRVRDQPSFRNIAFGLRCARGARRRP